LENGDNAGDGIEFVARGLVGGILPRSRAADDATPMREWLAQRISPEGGDDA